MDYGERQDRAEALVKAFLQHPDQTGVIYRDPMGRTYTAENIASEVMEETELGKNIVAVAGLVLVAMLSKDWKARA